MSRPNYMLWPKNWPHLQLHVDLGPTKIIVLLFTLLCLGFLGLGVSQLAHGAAAQLLWAKADGEVTGIKYEGGYRRKAPFTYFAFNTPDGQRHAARTPHTSAFHPAKVGDSVRVAYNSADPTRADLLHSGHLYGFALIYLLIAAALAWFTRHAFDGAIHLSVRHPPTSVSSPAQVSR